MLYTQRHLKLALKNTKNPHTHNLTRKIIENIESKISNPIMIADSLTDNKSIVILTDQLDESDNLILVSIKPDGKGIYNTEIIDSNFITSIYGKHGYEKFIQKNMDEGTVLYLNAKKIRGISSLLKLQLPQRFDFTSNNIYTIKESENICNIKADKNFFHPQAKLDDLYQNNILEKAEKLRIQIENTINNKISNHEMINFGKTPLSLQIVGCKDLPLLYTQNHLRKAIKEGKNHYHNLDIENLLFVQKNSKSTYNSRFYNR